MLLRVCLVISAIAAMVAMAVPIKDGAHKYRVFLNKDEPRPVRLAAAELQRYIYLLSGSLPSIHHTHVVHADGMQDDDIVVGSLADALAEALSVARPSLSTHKDHHILHTAHVRAHPIHLLMGTTPTATLYAAYRFCELHGVQYALHGDALPPSSEWRGLKSVNASEVPIFSLRGLHPFHDFAEGPDWWTVNDYKAVFSQMVKMRMNFFGLHTYSYNKDISATGTNEPTVWVGLKEDVNPDGSVKPDNSYPTAYQSTLRAEWSYGAVPTSKFSYGAKYLYEDDCYGSTTQKTRCPFPTSLQENADMFNAVADLLNSSFTYGRQLGLQTCVGNEAPLLKPFGDAAHTSQEYYEGMFSRIELAYPIDYYWIWTPEGWEWSHLTVNSSDFKEAVADFASALIAHDNVNASFKMATCGWVLGPLPNRTIFDQVLSKRYAAMSSLDMSVGDTDVDPSYAQVVNHDKWVIPWMEDDPGLTAPQLWVNRTLRHLLEAEDYNCNGALGIHWRTRALAPQISAMSQGFWNHLSSIDFWSDWCTVQFGSAVGAEAGAIFSSVDSFALPRPVQWMNGPGGLYPHSDNCDLSNYGFVGDFCALRPRVLDPAQHSNFDYWCNSLEYMRTINAFSCEWDVYHQAMAAASNPKLPLDQRRAIAHQTALPARVKMVQQATTMITLLLQTVSTRGEMGTVYNVLTHSLDGAFSDSLPELLELLEISVLPPEAIPPTSYQGPARLIVPTVRDALENGEDLWLQAIHLSEPLYPGGVALFYRPLGTQTFSLANFTRLVPDRPVFQLDLPAPSASIEYYVSDSDGLVWPSGAPAVLQTVVVA